MAWLIEVKIYIHANVYNLNSPFSSRSCNLDLKLGTLNVDADVDAKKTKLRENRRKKEVKQVYIDTRH